MVAQIPKGRVMTYGQIAAMCGSPRAARIVGGVAHFAPCIGPPACLAYASQPADLTAHQTSSGSATSSTYSNTFRSVAHQKKSAASSARHELCPAHDLAWCRVVKKDGSLAEGYPGGTEGHRVALEAEGVEMVDHRVNMSKHLWSQDMVDGR